jgi:hypothetical protein
MTEPDQPADVVIEVRIKHPGGPPDRPDADLGGPRDRESIDPETIEPEQPDRTNVGRHG